MQEMSQHALPKSSQCHTELIKTKVIEGNSLYQTQGPEVKTNATSIKLLNTEAHFTSQHVIRKWSIKTLLVFPFEDYCMWSSIL